jgi:hypothetical protein
MVPPAPIPEVFGPLTRLTQAIWPGTPVTPVMENGASDSIYFAQAGIPCYGYSAIALERDDERAHGQDERLPVDSYWKSLDFFYLGRERPGPHVRAPCLQGNQPDWHHRLCGGKGCAGQGGGGEQRLRGRIPEARGPRREEARRTAQGFHRCAGRGAQIRDPQPVHRGGRCKRGARLERRNGPGRDSILLVDAGEPAGALGMA